MKRLASFLFHWNNLIPFLNALLFTVALTSSAILAAFPVSAYIVFSVSLLLTTPASIAAYKFLTKAEFYLPITLASATFLVTLTLDAMFGITEITPVYTFVTTFISICGLGIVCLIPTFCVASMMAKAEREALEFINSTNIDK